MKKLFTLLFVCFLFSSCEIYSVMDLTQPMVVESKIDTNRYRVSYKYNNIPYFCDIITPEDNFKPGDTIVISKK